MTPYYFGVNTEKKVLAIRYTLLYCVLNMKLKIEIVMNGTAFEPENGTEAARILRELADEICGRQYLVCAKWSKSLLDVNGNRVGEAKVTR